MLGSRPWIWLAFALFFTIQSPAFPDDDPTYDEPKQTPMDFTVGTGIISVRPILQYSSPYEMVINGKLTLIDSGETYQWRGALDVSIPTEALNKRELRTIDAVIGGKWKVFGNETYINKIENQEGDALYSRCSVGFDLLFSQETHEGEPPPQTPAIGEIKQSLLGLVATAGITGLNIGKSQWDDRFPKVSTFDISLKAGVGNFIFDPNDSSYNARKKEVQGALFEARADYADYDNGTGVYAQYTGLMVQNSSNDVHRYQIGAYLVAGILLFGGGLDFLFSDLGEVRGDQPGFARTEVYKGFFTIGLKVF